MKEASNNEIRYILTSHSIDNLFDYCARKFEFLNVYDRRPQRESGFAAQVGTALHDGTQAWLIARAEGKSAIEQQRIGHMTMLKMYPWETEREQKTQARSFDKAILALHRIITDPAWDDWELLWVDGKGWAIEVPFLIRHTTVGEFILKNTGERCMLATQGKIDFILRHRVTGKIRTWDLKTTILGPDMARAEYTFSGQQVGYSNVATAMAGISMDDMSFHYLICRFSSDEEPTIQPMEIVKDRDDIEDYWLAKMDRLYRMKNYAEAGWFPRTNGGCHSWGHECSMLDICKTRDYDLINRWFSDVSAEPQQGYDYWVELDV